MSYIEMKNISKVYKGENDREKYALDHIYLSLPNKGLVSIVGKSGSGKSTIINLLALLDKPTSGNIYINNENIGLWKKKRIEKYHNQDIGIVFQHYHLLEEHTVLFNVMLPSLINGVKEKEAKNTAISLLKSISFPENLYQKPCKNLSGGEKERVALLRALINNPKILLCDEPTGALDSNNSIAVMEILKKISEDRLVIVVSHNLDLVKKYADRIIEIKDGKIEKDKTIKQINKTTINKTEKKKRFKNKWSDKITLNNFKRRILRNVISIITLSIGIISSLLIIGFSYGSSPSIKETSLKQFNYGWATISKQKSESIAGSKMSLVQQTRPTFMELDQFHNILDNYVIENNFSSLVPLYSSIKLGEEKLTDYSYNPIYSFSNNYIDSSLLIKGYFPSQDNLYEVVINKKAYDFLKKKGIEEPLDISLDISYEKEFHYYTGDEQNPCINDIFSYQKTCHIVGVVDEMNFLSTPKIYYSYSSLVEYLFDYPLINLSSYLNRNITWYERVATSLNNDEISSYSYYLFLKDIRLNELVSKHIEEISDPYVIESTPVVLSNTLLNLVSVATMGMELFLIIAILGTALIIGIVSFSSYSEDKKIIAILSSLGANRGEIIDIYVLENIMVAIISLSNSLLINSLLSLLANPIIDHFTGFQNMVVIPFLNFLGHPFLLIAIIVVVCFLLSIIATVLPIIFSSKISLKKELADE